MRSTLIPARARRVLLPATGVVLLAFAGSAIGITSAAGAAAIPHPTTKVPKLSHQLCYFSNTQPGVPGFKIPTGVLLSNQFNPGGFRPKIGPAVLNCNPVIKIVQTSTGSKRTYPITYPDGHLACFTITESVQKLPRSIIVVNQFGRGTLFPSQPNLLCLPTWKSLTKPPVEKTAEPPFLDHFTCYPVQGPNTWKIPPGIQLQDEFTAKPVGVDVQSIATLLCLPTTKRIGKKVYKIVHPNVLLVCYPVGTTPIKSPVFDLNQFGRATIIIKKTDVLCLPSKKVTGPAGG